MQPHITSCALKVEILPSIDKDSTSPPNKIMKIQCMLNLFFKLLFAQIHVSFTYIYTHDT